MEQIVIRNLGIGALIIETEKKRILIDAFNTLIEPTNVLSGDIIIFTHDDGDHFCPEKLPLVKGQDITIIGPPSIVKPVLISGKADIEQIEVLYTNSYSEPSKMSLDQINIICYNTRHFNHWDPLHNSYLIEMSGRRIYITGDSTLTSEQVEIIGETDAVICNLVDEGYLKGKDNAEIAIQHTYDYLSKIRSECKTKMIIGVHLLAFDWTVDADKLKEYVDLQGLENIIIPVSSQQNI